ncbi:MULTISPECIES: hypothetical protein [unclassified Fusobacterium]|uniref:hypothetical protein n=1 Tax=unclassified Fusobacterium TaxID=2648384 RepID=UPI001B8CDACC|nr:MULTISPECIES: hypothetical protein [unclassified Fusobacterium]MBR8701458.1 hypothetical protein [Fusobacterium sp. DD45]MBR8711226.1 hypothetical protein [Fusobacterium sp. DD28]MBR8751781.1 hypothetical protein [Fusobacterium sp. DD26]
MEKSKKDKGEKVINEIPKHENLYIYKGPTICKSGYFFKNNTVITGKILAEISEKQEFKENITDFIELGKYA